MDTRDNTGHSNPALGIVIAVIMVLALAFVIFGAIKADNDLRHTLYGAQEL